MNRNLYLAGLAVAACALAAGVFSARNIAISNDSMTYALVADQVRQGHGLKVPLITTEGNPSILTFQPPLYPLMLAGLG